MKIARSILSGILTLSLLSGAFTGVGAAESAPPFTEEKLEFTASNGEKLAYYLVKPLDFDENSQYPLVVYLHGVGGDTDTSGYEALKNRFSAVA